MINHWSIDSPSLAVVFILIPYITVMNIVRTMLRAWVFAEKICAMCMRMDVPKCGDYLYRIEVRR